ncbi:gibberellin 2-beta-dioxygenase 2-like [Ziziphus jujuba]|uniref:Gibberellin 2-beta-dioxygenase 2-like n=1 Tax=Ziziphus jujuba TaxID=326968 RepID=A0A6P4B2D6_ZIZJJ|nr:gibberellin 2-beta-dioxygenase 2-like [Ziziphus jujuba]
MESHSVMEDILGAARRSHKQPQEVKNGWYLHYLPKHHEDDDDDSDMIINDDNINLICVQRGIDGVFKELDPNVVDNPTIGGLQVDHQNHWVDVKPEIGAFIVNIGDLIQLITNDKFKSIKHRVLVPQETKSRVSLACLLTPDDKHKKIWAKKGVSIG